MGKETTFFKPGNKARQGKGVKEFKDDFLSFMGDLPPGVKPWEIIQQVVTSETCTDDNKIKGSAILMKEMLNESGATIEINADKLEINNIDDRIRELTKTSKEIEAELALEEAEEAKSNGEEA
jgi:hypothetical protein